MKSFFSAGLEVKSVHQQVTKLLLALATISGSLFSQTGTWTAITTTNEPLAREECSFSSAGNQFILLGGRGIMVAQAYDPATKTWTNKVKPPIAMNHMQAIEYFGLVVVMGAFNDSTPTNSYPHEKPIPDIYFFDPLGNQWVKGPSIPAGRRRGSAGLALDQGKIYMALGIQDGHSKGWVPWLDSYVPLTGKWDSLPDAPRERDHFQTAILGGKLYAIGGRRSGWADTHPGQTIFTNLEKTDIYDIATKTWSTLPSPTGDLPKPRSGAVVKAIGDEIVFAGGGSQSNGTLAHNETHALSSKTLTWRQLANMVTGRQVTGGILSNGGLYIASGSGGSGGGPQLKTMEVFFMGEKTEPNGVALTAGSLATTPLNFGIIPTAEKPTKTFGILHNQGNQAVVVSGMQISAGGTNFSLATPFTTPVVVAPGEALPVALTLTSHNGTPIDGTLQITLSVPAAKTVVIPIEANRTVASIFNMQRTPAKNISWNLNYLPYTSTENKLYNLQGATSATPAMGIYIENK